MTATIFLSSLVAERNILLIRAVFRRRGEAALVLTFWRRQRRRRQKKKSPLLQRCKSRPRDASDDSQNILDQHSCHSLLEFIRMRYRVTIRLLAGFYIRRHARLRKFCFDCVVTVDDNSDIQMIPEEWLCTDPHLHLLPLLLSPVMHLLYSALLSPQHLVYFVFLSLTRVHLTASHLTSRIRDKDLDPTRPRKKKKNK